MTSKPRLTLYGSGDTGTKELLSALRAKRVPHVFLDIRDPWDSRANLRALLATGVHTVPQLYAPDGSHIGAHAEAKAHVATLPYAHEGALSA